MITKEKIIGSYPNPLLWKANARAFTATHADIKMPAQLIIKAGTVLSPGGNVMYKSGKVQAAITAGTALKLEKDHSFGVGDKIYSGTLINIDAIDTSNDDYDLLTMAGAVTFTLAGVVFSTNAGAVATSGLSVVVETVIFTNSTDVKNLVIADKAILSISEMPNYWDAAITGDLKTV